MRSLRLAAIQPPREDDQLPPELYRSELVKHAFELLDRAVARDCDLALLPEHFSTAPGSNQYEEESGELLTRLRRLAQAGHMAIVAPVRLLDEGLLRNTAWVISADGELLGRYFKVHPTDGEMESGIVPGDSWPVFEIEGVRVGVMICHDNSFPESARCLALGGAELICWPHVQSGWGDTAWEVVLRSRAIDNGVYLLSSCYGLATTERAWRPGMMVGRSGVIGPDGTPLLDASRSAGVVDIDIDFDFPLLKHSFTRSGDHPFRREMLRSRRPDTYGAIAADRSEVEAAAGGEKTLTGVQ